MLNGSFSITNQDPIKLVYDKWKDLNDLKPLILIDCHPYYANLLHQEACTSIRKNKNKKEETKRGNAKQKKLKHTKGNAKNTLKKYIARSSIYI